MWYVSLDKLLLLRLVDELGLIYQSDGVAIVQIRHQVFENVLLPHICLSRFDVAHQLAHEWVKADMASFGILFQAIVTNVSSDNIFDILHVIK